MQHQIADEALRLDKAVKAKVEMANGETVKVAVSKLPTFLIENADSIEKRKGKPKISTSIREGGILTG